MSPEQDVYGECAEFYDFVPSYAQRPDVPFFVEMARRAEGGGILEVGCGTGRVLIPVARVLSQSPVLGQILVGVDSSQAMLNICQGKLLRENPRVTVPMHLVEDDMRNLVGGALQPYFNLVIVPFRAFQHPSDG